MKRHNAIKKVKEAILKDDLVEALFLKGSIARGDDDDYSDVDMYVVVSPEKQDLFLTKRIQYLEAYMPLIYWSESNFVGPQIVGVFEDALHFDLYTVTLNTIPQTDDIKILYDERGLLDFYRKKPLSISSADVVENIHKFTFVLLEFEAAYMRKDFIWSVRLLYVLSAHLSFVVRYIYDENNSQLALKRLYKVIPGNVYNDFIDIFENATPSNVLNSVKMIVSLAEKQMETLPREISSEINMKFFKLMQMKIAAM